MAEISFEEMVELAGLDGPTMDELKDAYAALEAHLTAATERAEKAERQNGVMRRALENVVGTAKGPHDGFETDYWRALDIASTAIEEVDGE